MVDIGRWGSFSILAQIPIFALVENLMCPTWKNLVKNVPFSFKFTSFTSSQSTPTLLGPAHVSASKDRGGLGGASLPPYVFWVSYGLGFQFFLEMNGLVVIYHIQKDS